MNHQSEKKLAEARAKVSVPIVVALLFGALVFVPFALHSPAIWVVVALFGGVAAVMALGRKRYVVWEDRLEVGSLFGRRVLPFAAVRHVFGADPLASLTALSGAVGELKLYDDQGRKWSVPGSAGAEGVRKAAHQAALPRAVEAAEEQIRSGGTYRDPDKLHGLDQSTLYGFTSGLTIKKSSVSLAEVSSVDLSQRSPGAGAVVLKDGSRPMLVGALDEVLVHLLSKRGLVN